MNRRELISDWKHRVRDLINRFGIDMLPINRSPISVIHSLKEMDIRTVIDIGANEGQYARRARRQFPQAMILSFEPLPEPFSRLNEWASMQGGRAVGFQVALGDKEAELAMNHHIDHSPSSSFLKITRDERQAEIIVRQTTLDKAIDESKIRLAENVLVKMDVQGYEDRVVKGGMKTLGMAKACLLEIGLAQIYENQASFSGLVDEMKKCGMRFAGVADQVHDTKGNAKYIDALFVRDDS